MAKFKEKPVIRDDGKRYKSVSDAARDLVKELSIERNQKSVASDISANAMHKKGRNSVYGHTFEYANREDRDDPRSAYARWFGKRLETLRKNRYITSEKLSRELCDDSRTVSYFEAGKDIPDAYEVYLLSKALDVSADVLLGVVGLW